MASRVYKNEPSFWNSTKEFVQETIGSQYQDSINRMEKGQKYFTLPVGTYPFPVFIPEEPDPNYIWNAEENMVGYRGENGGRDYFDYMAEQNITNKFEHDIIKMGIDQDEERSQYLDNLEGWDFWGPAIASAAFNPLTYTPIGLTRGIGYIPNMLKVGSVSAGIVGVEEVYRHANSHTATLEESIAYIGGASVFGGLFATIPVKLKRMKLNKEKTKIIRNKHSDETEINNYLDAEQTTYGGVPINFDLDIDGITRTISRGKTGWTRHYLSEDGERIFVRDKKARKNNLTYNPINYSLKDGKEFVDVDDAMIKIMYQKYKNGHEYIGIPKKLSPILNSERKFADFLVRREVIRDINQAPRTGKTLKQQEEELSNEVVAEAVRRSDVDFSPDFGQSESTLGKLKFLGFNYVAKGMDTLLSPFGKQASYLKNHRKAYNMGNMLMHRLIGDWGTRNKFADRGMIIDRSVLMNRDIKWGMVKNTLDKKLDSAYTLYTKGIQDSVHETDQFRQNLFLGNSVVKNTIKQLGDGLTGTESSTADRLSRKVSLDNFRKKGQKLKNKILNNEQHIGESVKTKAEFDMYASELLADEDFFIREKARALTPDHVKAIDDARNGLREFYETFEKEMVELKMLATKSSAMDKTIDIENRIARIKTKLENKISKEQKSFLQSALDLLEEQKVKTKNLLDDITDLTPPNEKPGEYFHRIWNMQAIEANMEAFKKILIRGIYEHRDLSKVKLQKNQTLDDWVNKKADSQIDHILGVEGPFLDPYNIHEFTGSTKVRPLIHRTILNPNKDFMNVDGIDFIQTNSREVAAQYRQYMGTAIEMYREFGDRHALFNKLDLMETIAEKKNFDINQANAMVNNFDNQVFNLYGITNFTDPRAYSKRFVDAAKGITSLNSMGNVMLTSTTELARPVGIHGLGRTMSLFGWTESYGKSFAELNDAMQKQIAEQHSYLYTYMELQTLGGGFERMVNSDVGGVYHGTRGERFIRDIQKPYYLMNGLTQYTGNLKNYQAGLSSHRFIEDALALANGKLNKADTDRLLAYGIDKRFSQIIKNLHDDGVIQTVTKEGRVPLYLANINKWSETKGGTEALRRFRTAIRADVERAIVTPNVADKYNMMNGKVVINNEYLRNVFASEGGMAKGAKKIAELIGITITPTTRGTVISNAFLLPTLQFYAWSIAANRKILASGLAGRDRQYLSYMFGALGFAHMANTYKINKFEYAPLEEQLLFDIETSGILGSFSDANRMLENLTYGEYGIRESYGMDQMFGPKTEGDLQGQIMGPAYSKSRSWWEAYNSGDPYALKFRTKQLIPLQNLYPFKALNKILSPIGMGDLDDTVLDKIFDTEPKRKFGRKRR